MGPNGLNGPTGPQGIQGIQGLISLLVLALEWTLSSIQRQVDKGMPVFNKVYLDYFEEMDEVIKNIIAEAIAIQCYLKRQNI
jgi:hypothetical protein